MAFDHSGMRKYLAFIKAVEYGTLTSAAEAMDYSQSAVSKMIGELEDDWGVQLLNRNRNGVTPTEVGKELLPIIRKTYDRHLQLMDRVSELSQKRRGLIRISTVSSVATYLLPAVIKEFTSDYPDVSFSIQIKNYLEIEDDLQRDRKDIGITILPSVARLDTIPLYRDRLKAILPPDHPESGDNTFQISSLPKYPFILLKDGDLSEISQFLDMHRIQPMTKIITIDDYAIMSMVEQGIGISILPELILRRCRFHIVQKELSIPAYRMIGIAMRKKSELSSMATAFLDYLLDIAPKLCAEEPEA